MSETIAARHVLLPFCQGMGLDLGYGGSAIQSNAITVDLPKPYTSVGEDPLNLWGDARYLYWFKTEVLDYVYSSHLLEDFPPTETAEIVNEWLRVLKVGGKLVLLLPDEPVFREHCARTQQSYNMAHKNHDLTLEWFKTNIVFPLGNWVSIVFEQSPINIYSFAIVLRKN